MTIYTTPDDGYSLVDPAAHVYEDWIPAVTFIHGNTTELPAPPKAYKRADWYKVDNGD